MSGETPQMDEMTVNKVGDTGRTMLMSGKGEPVLIELAMRMAESALEGTRVKCAFVAITLREDGEYAVVPLPFSVPVLPSEIRLTGDGEGKPMRPTGFSPEFRLEMQ